jgi:putative hydroxymethylpyrimidine transport system substrate-binding protein
MTTRHRPLNLIGVIPAEERLMNTSSLLSRRSLVTRGGIIAAGALAAPALLRGASAQEPTKVTLALDWYPNANHTGLYVAQDAGYFTEAGLEVEIYVPADPTTVLQTVGAGRDTFGISYHADVLFARAQDVPVKSVAAMVQHPLNCLMFKADAPIERPSDLSGRTVGVTGLPSDDAFLGTILAFDGLSLDDIEVVNVGYDLLPAVLSDQADAVLGAYWTHETILAEQQGLSVRYLRVEEWGVPDYYELVLVSGDDVASGTPDVVSGLLGALQRGYTDAIADPAAALELLYAQNPDLDPAVEEEGLGLLAPLWTDNGTVAFGTQTPERWDAFGTWLKEQGLLAAETDIPSAYDATLLPDSGTATPEATPAG